MHNLAHIKTARDIARAKGLCITCCSRPATQARRATYDLPATRGYVTCLECRERQARLRDDRREAGKCTRCGAPGMSRWALCTSCRARGQAHVHARRKAA